MNLIKDAQMLIRYRPGYKAINILRKKNKIYIIHNIIYDRYVENTEIYIMTENYFPYLVRPDDRIKP